MSIIFPPSLRLSLRSLRGVEAISSINDTCLRWRSEESWVKNRDTGRRARVRLADELRRSHARLTSRASYKLVRSSRETGSASKLRNNHVRSFPLPPAAVRTHFKYGVSASTNESSSSSGKQFDRMVAMCRYCSSIFHSGVI